MRASICFHKRQVSVKYCASRIRSEAHFVCFTARVREDACRSVIHLDDTKQTSGVAIFLLVRRVRRSQQVEILWTCKTLCLSNCAFDLHNIYSCIPLDKLQVVGPMKLLIREAKNHLIGVDTRDTSSGIIFVTRKHAQLGEKVWTSSRAICSLGARHTLEAMRNLLEKTASSSSSGSSTVSSSGFNMVSNNVGGKSRLNSASETISTSAMRSVTAALCSSLATNETKKAVVAVRCQYSVRMMQAGCKGEMYELGSVSVQNTIIVPITRRFPEELRTVQSKGFHRRLLLHIVLEYSANRLGRMHQEST